MSQIDAARQIRGRLQIQRGGTGNDQGDARGVVLPIAYFPADFGSGGTDPLPFGSLVKLEGSKGTSIPTVASTDRSIGASLGTFDPSDGSIDLGGDVAAGDMAAIALVGMARVLFDTGTYTAGQFVYPSSTSGEAQAVTGFRKNAIGVLVDDISGGGTARVLIVNVLGSISGGLSGDLHASYFGDESTAGSVGLMADAGHVHQREPDISALVTGTPVATASTEKVAHPAADAIDGNGSTYWESDGGSTPSLVVDLGMPRQIIRAVMVQGGNGGNNFTQYTLAHSDDNSTWHNVTTVTAQGAGVTSAVEPTAVITDRYWRWTTGGLTGNAQVPEVDLRSVPYGPIDDTTGLIDAAFLPGGGSLAYEDLSDVDMTGISDGDGPIWDAGSSTWLPGTPGAIAFEDLTDVDMTGVTDGDVPVWDAGSSTWLPGAGGGGSGASADGAIVRGSAHTGLADLTALTWDSADFDPSGYYAGGAPTRLTVPTGEGGRLFAAWSVVEITDGSNGGEQVRLDFLVNGTPVWIGVKSSATFLAGSAAVLYLQDGDYVEVRINVGAGSNKIITTDQIPYFGLAPLGGPIGPAGPAGPIDIPEVVQAKINGTGAITSITLPQTPIAGNTILLAVDGFNSGNISAVACTNVTWTFIDRIVTSGGAHVELYAGHVGSSPGTVISWTNPNSFTTAVAIEIGASVASTPVAASVAHGQLFTDLLGLASVTAGHLIVAIGAVDNTTANNWVGLSLTIPSAGVNNGRVSIQAGYAQGNPVYLQTNSNVAAAGGAVIAEIT